MIIIIASSYQMRNIRDEWYFNYKNKDFNQKSNLKDFNDSIACGQFNVITI